MARVLQRIARRDNPPELVELQPAQRDFRHQRVARMGRIERSAKQPDSHALFNERHAQMRIAHAGKIVT